MKIKKWIFLLLSVSLITIKAHANQTDVDQSKNMAIAAQLGGSFPTFAGGSFGADIRFEYAVLPFLSIIVPVQVRYLAIGAFAGSNAFRSATAGWGGRFYFSRFFWPQKKLQGFFTEAHMGIGFGIEYPGDKRGVKQASITGTSFSLSGALGYNHLFDCGFILGGSINITAQGFTWPIEQAGLIVHPVPEILAHIGWAF
jgi:hypothetical protein